MVGFKSGRDDVKRKNILVPSKGEYVRGKRPNVDCILCSLIAHDTQVTDTLLWEGEKFAIALNLYPYNPGHIMIFPKRHITSLEELTKDEALKFFELTIEVEKILDKEYGPCGFNIGFNLGPCSGASISHIHLHIVPRYKNELSFMDVLGGAKVIVEDPLTTRDRLRKEFGKII